ncbi:protein-methionine-sulfoxide reductase catalytic subunit MsrP [soil metagenome]
MRDLGNRIPDSEITPPEVYFSRRNFLRGAALVGSVAATGGLYRLFNSKPAPLVQGAKLEGLVASPAANSPSENNDFHVDEPMTSEQDITHYNNFYEFSTAKDGVAGAAKDFKTDGWKVTVDGLVRKGRVFGMDEIRAVSTPEERVYRMRCVEAWSMVIPWAGYSLSKLLEVVEPLPEAKYVAFETLMDIERMPGQASDILQWPYVEGLRLDEAMHPLAILATGLYGRELPPQDGAPIRLVTPWKYGFKGIKSIVKITLTDKMPPTSWNRYATREYGFFANVNPEVDHPRWSQATEQRIGESGRRKTLMFNGYGEQVAGLYKGMDLRANY